jgi:hypothetical protein
MKLIIYTLNVDGTIPDYIIDGGYLPYYNNGISPQDYDLVGVAADSAEQIGFLTELDLLAYVESKDFKFIEPITLEITPIEEMVTFLWNKLQQ